MLPQDSKLILFGSVKIMDTRKGVDYMIKACKLLAEKYPELKEQLGVVVFGNQSQQIQNMLPFKVYPLAFVSNEHQLVDIYNSVDLFVTPSLEENLPNMIMEAMSCGIPFLIWVALRKSAVKKSNRMLRWISMEGMSC